MPQIWRLSRYSPRVMRFIALAVPMLALVLYAMRDVSLEPSQRLWLAVATLGLAAVSAWVITRA